MKKGDYQSPQAVEKYATKRFAGGLTYVSADELDIIKKWIRKSNINNDMSKIYLDIGTGTGRVLDIILAAKPKKIYALDKSQAMLGYIKKNYSKTGLVQTFLAPSNKIPLKDNSVDTVTALHLVKHLENVKSTILEVKRVLKSGGYFIFDVLNRNSLIQLNLGTCYAISRKEIINILESMGFRVKKIYSLHTFGETVYNLFGSNSIFRNLDFFLSKKLESGTKLIVIAEKI